MADNRLMSRSDFLRNGFKAMIGYAADLVDQAIEEKVERVAVPVLRPPGAIDELAFLLKCSRCNQCIDACPHDAIVIADETHGTASGTPTIKPAETPCQMCEDYPCIAACTDEALVPTETLKVGTAHLIYTRCFAYSGQICDYCVERCPLKGDAIIIEDRKPQVVEAHCTGCGICEYICPAPGNGIVVLPERN